MVKIDIRGIILLFVVVIFSGCQSLSKERSSLAATRQSKALKGKFPIVETLEQIEGAKSSIVYAKRPVLGWDCLQMPAITAYEIVISKNQDFSDFVVQQDILVSGQCVFKVEAELEDKAVYYWKVRAKTNKENGPWSDIRQFNVDFSFIPSPPKLKNPLPGAQNYPLQPTFEWFFEPRASEHNIEVSEGDPDFKDEQKKVFSDNISGTLFVSRVRFKPGKTYFWRMRSIRAGVAGSFGEIRKFTTISDTLPPRIEVVSAVDILAPRIPAVFDMKIIVVDQGDPAVGTQKVEGYFNDKSIPVTMISEKDGSYACALSSLTEGLNRVTVIAYDRIGNKTLLPVDLKVTVGKARQKQGWLDKFLGSVKKTGK